MPRRTKKVTGTRKAPHMKRRKWRGKYKAKGPAVIKVSAGRIVMLIPRRLKSPNQRTTWRAEHGEKMAWKRLIEQAESNIDIRDAKDRYGGAIPVITRMRLDILRLAPNQRYMMDADNLSFSAKRLQDTLKEKGYIVDDNMRWLDGPHIVQGISDDKCYWTIITLSQAADATVFNFPVVSAKDEVERRLKAAERGLRLHGVGGRIVRQRSAGPRKPTSASYGSARRRGREVQRGRSDAHADFILLPRRCERTAGRKHDRAGQR
jgi:hypothetical protein